MKKEIRLLSGGPRFQQPKADIIGQGWGVLAKLGKDKTVSTNYTHSQKYNPFSKVEKYKKATTNRVSCQQIKSSHDIHRLLGLKC